MIKTTDYILTEACIELALLLTDQTSHLLTATTPTERWKLKQDIADTYDTYHKLLQGIRS